jgi:hypothetical protein
MHADTSAPGVESHPSGAQRVVFCSAGNVFISGICSSIYYFKSAFGSTFVADFLLVTAIGLAPYAIG